MDISGLWSEGLYEVKGNQMMHIKICETFNFKHYHPLTK